MGIPNLLPFPMQPNVRLPFRWTHSLLKKRPTRAASTLTALPLPPKAPLAAQQGSEAGIIRAGFVLHLSQVQSLLHSLGSFAGCWQSFFLCTFTSRLRSAPNCTEQRKAFSAIINEETSSLPQQSLKCFESMGLEDNSSDIWYWERGGTPPPPELSPKSMFLEDSHCSMEGTQKAPLKPAQTNQTEAAQPEVAHLETFQTIATGRNRAGSGSREPGYKGCSIVQSDVAAQLLGDQARPLLGLGRAGFLLAEAQAALRKGGVH